VLLPREPGAEPGSPIGLPAETNPGVPYEITQVSVPFDPEATVPGWPNGNGNGDARANGSGGA